MSTREVSTPGNRPALFARKKAPRQPDYYDPYYPLRHLDVPKSDSIYKRCHYGLQSGDPDEVDFALYHLVQMSNQRGDKFKFEGFPLLAETLMEKAMEITWLCSGVKWELEYDFRKVNNRLNVLNALHGTPDLLDRIKMLPVTLPDDGLETESFINHLRNIKEATLVLRNMCLLVDNAIYLSRYVSGLLRDFLVIMINVPNQPRFNELRNDALDIAQEVTKFLPTGPRDPLCISLYRCLESPDRAHVVRALAAICHFSSETGHPTPNRALEQVPRDTLVHLFSFMLLKEDEQTLSGAMDFWYQFTLSPELVESIIDVVSIPRVFVPRLVDLLSYESRKFKEERVLQEEKWAPAATEIPKIPPELMKELLQIPEPERSSRWLRCCFAEDPDSEITQIALWQAYQSRFGNPQQTSVPILPAAEFIKNVSTTFSTAMAQVVSVNGGQTSKFIIKGIRPLETAVTFDGWPFQYCRWRTEGTKQCGRAFTTPKDLRVHVFEEHMGLKKRGPDESSPYNLDKADKPIHTCRWNNCNKFRAGPTSDTFLAVEHVGSHLPLDRPPDARPPPTPARTKIQSRSVVEWYWDHTPVTMEGQPVGVAYKAALVLRNLAMNLPTTNAEQYGNIPWRKAAFLSHRKDIIAAWDTNRTLRMVLTELLMLLEREE